ERDSSGCPLTVVDGANTQGCVGYELMADLDFDTNADGVMDENDTYWNEGAGWEPIGKVDYNSPNAYFSGIFDANGFSIRNLYIDSSSYYQGLFGMARNAVLRNLILTGPLTSVSGDRGVGILAGRLESSDVTNIYASGSVFAINSSWGYAGGIAGYASDTSLLRVQSAVAVDGYSRVGGVVGSAGDISSFMQVLATGAVNGSRDSGGIVGYASGYDISDSYWATDTTGQSNSSRSGTTYNYSGATLAQLQCPLTGDDTACLTNTTLYADWSTEYWDFGTSEQLPALKINGRTIRDSDGDGVLDYEDAFPNNFAVSIDADQDGYADRLTNGCDFSCFDIGSEVILDAFPGNAAAWQDDDRDGLPDAWAEGCDLTCQGDSGLTLDTHLNDSDNDGLTNDIDSDDYGDGITDADADSDGLIEIYTLAQLNAVRFDLKGLGRVMTEGAERDSSGCPLTGVDGAFTQGCVGYELMADLDFDTNADGVMDENDIYWNDGAGWEPIGTYSNNPGESFSGVFEGNGFAIRNPYIDSSSRYQGLFGGTRNAELRNIILTGPLTAVTGDRYVGLLAGRLVDSEVTDVYASGSVFAINSSWGYAGGIAGYASDTSLLRVQSAVAVEGHNYVGGVIGDANATPSIMQVLATGVVSGGSSVGGIVGYASGYDISDSYWATDTTGQDTSAGEDKSLNYVGATLAQLQCPLAGDDTACNPDTILYAGWSPDHWDFGSENQLPGLIIADMIVRDSDGDGTLDVNTPPSVRLRLLQGGEEESTIVEGMGDVTLEALVTNLDESERYKLTWALEGIPEAIELGDTVTFKPDNLPAGDYTLSVTVTDSGYPQMSDTAEMVVRVISNVAEPNITEPEETPGTSQAPASKKKGGGGSLQWWLLLLAAGLIRRPARFAV
ncbi:MAG: autotransporter subunit C, partial [Pseudomonadota bacterium]|nr:autotransporter subunit C [Pseudomonadota bacterium]